jgi:hypothetical protein
VARHAHREELVCAKTQHVEHRWIDVIEWPVDAGGEDSVVGAAAPQCSVGQLDGEGRVATVQRPRGEQPGHRKVRVGIALVDGPE